MSNISSGKFLRNETYQELDSHSQREIVESFQRLFQSETQENWSELMQLYADAGHYSQAEKIVDKITGFSEQSESVKHFVQRICRVKNRKRM